MGLNESGSAESTTKAAVSAGTIVIRDGESQPQDIAVLSRDVEHANQTLNPIFDKEKEQNRIREAQLIAEIGSQAGDIARTEGQIRATKAGKAELEKKGVKAPDVNAPKKAWEAYNSQLEATESYKAVEKQWATGSAIQQGIQAATAAIQGLAGGNMAQAISGAAAPYLAEKIHELTTDANGKVNVQANLMAHAVVGAVTSHAAGNSALAGASGAVMGEYIAQQLYPGVERKALTEEQRQTISALGTLAAGLAGGIVGDSTADAVAGAQAGKNAVENNALNAKDEKKRKDAEWSLPYIKDEKQRQQAEKLKSDLDKKSAEFNAAFDNACKALSSAQCTGMRAELAAMAKSYDEKMDDQYIGNMGSVYKEGKAQVDALIWQYATGEAKAEREANVNRIAENWGVSKEKADVLYTAMAGVHTIAAIGGAAYGMKEGITVEKGSTSVVESEKAALERISQNVTNAGNLNSKQNYSVLDQQAAKSSVIIEQDKLKYLFGEVNSSTHNMSRSTQLAQTMYRLGISLDDAGAKLITEHISQVPKMPGSIVNVYTNQFGKFEVRESLLMGPSGKATKLETSFQIMDNGSRRFVTTIPKDGRK